MERHKEYLDFVHRHIRPITAFDDPSLDVFLWLARSIEEGKPPLKVNSVDFIIIKILNKEDQVYNLKRKGSFDVYVLGSFRKYFKPTLKVAESFALFYMEYGVLPSIISIPKHILMENKKSYSAKLKNGVLLYERGRSIFSYL